MTTQNTANTAKHFNVRKKVTKPWPQWVCTLHPEEETNDRNVPQNSETSHKKESLMQLLLARDMQPNINDKFYLH